MHFDLSNLSSLIGLVGFVGGAAGVLSYGRAKTIMELQEKEIAARKESEERKDQEYKEEMATMTQRVNECMAKTAAAEARAATLQELAQQTPAIEKLAEVTAKQHSEIIEALSDLAKAINNDRTRSKKNANKT